MLESRGSAPRIYKNTLVFLAADRARLADLDEAVRYYLAWNSIVEESEGDEPQLNLDANQRRQAKTQRDNAHTTVNARIPETYQWLLVPVQPKPQDPVQWQAFRLQGQEALAVRASRKLKNDELLISKLAATRLRLELDNVPLWRGEHVPVKQLAEDFARYLYLPRLRNTQVLVDAVQDGVALFSWQQDSFAFAESYDEVAKRYRGLRFGQHVTVSEDDQNALLVKPTAAQQQFQAEQAATATAITGTQPSLPARAGRRRPTDHTAREAARPAETKAVLRLSEAEPSTGWPRRRQDCRGNCPTLGPSTRRNRRSCPRNHRSNARRRSRQHCPHRHRERTYPEIHRARI